VNSRQTSNIGRAAGFSLIELMVVVLIASILIVTAASMYQTSVRKSRRTDARNALLDLAGREERYLSLNNTYTNVPANLGYGAVAIPFAVGNNANYYQISAIVITAPTLVGGVATPATFTITAVPIGTQVNDTPCASFTVTSTGSQSALNSGGADNTAACWQGG
jgi:type IV pilus assembly protein PilE